MWSKAEEVLIEENELMKLMIFTKLYDKRILSHFKNDNNSKALMKF